MIEYPSIINSSKAPRKGCIAFDKLDGSNFRAKWTQKKGFATFGTRTQLIDETSEFWGNMVSVFRKNNEEILDKLFRKNFPNEREILIFGEYFGKNSFAGRHDPNEEQRIVFFDIFVGHKNQKFLKPQEFVKFAGDHFEIPRIVYSGNMNESLIERVRADEFGTEEGVICKGTEPSGAFRGGVWMCKIKTQRYLDKLKDRFGDDWQRYAE